MTAYDSRCADADGSAEARLFADGLANAYLEVLGTSIAGVILHGSLVLGGYVSGRSDVDLLVVVEEALADEQVDGIEAVVVDCTPHPPGSVDRKSVV